MSQNCQNVLKPRSFKKKQDEQEKILTSPWYIMALTHFFSQDVKRLEDGEDLNDAL